jgi:hypothetical protein
MTWACRCRQQVFERTHPGCHRLPRLVADIDLARGVVADEDHREPRLQLMGANQRRHGGADAFEDAGGNRLAFDRLGRHVANCRMRVCAQTTGT